MGPCSCSSRDATVDLDGSIDVGIEAARLWMSTISAVLWVVIDTSHGSVDYWPEKSVLRCPPDGAQKNLPLNASWRPRATFKMSANSGWDRNASSKGSLTR